MKRILSIMLVALFMATSVVMAAPSGPGAPGEILGQGYRGDPHRIFRLVHVSPDNNDSDGLAAGSVVCWDNSLDDGVSVELTTTSGDGAVAGVLVTAVISNDTAAAQITASDDPSGNANWGWLQTYGLSLENPTVGAAAPVVANATVCAGATAASVSEWRANVSTTNSGILGCALNSAAASAEVQIFITRD